MLKLVICTLVAATLPSLAFADAEAGRRKSASCTTCHGNDGNSAAAAYPNLAGQTAPYLYKQLKDFKEGRRKDQVMSTMVGFMTDEDMKDLADFFSVQSPAHGTFKADPELVAQGKKIAQELQCMACHQSNFKGLNEFPRVTRQQYNYTVKQLKDFRDGVRTNDNGSMAIVKNLTDDQIKALAHYLSTL
jgi:cytochrome c553